MPRASHVNAHYLPCVAATRARVTAGVEALLAALDDPDALLGFLLEYCAMRIGPLRPIPTWLDRAADKAAAAGHDEVAAELELAAAREQEHRLLLIDDLVHLRELWYRRVASDCELDLLALVQQGPDAAALRHAKLREFATAEPLAMIAAELELAEFGRSFGPALLEACFARLGSESAACLRFIEARTQDAHQRAADRELRLEALLDEFPEQAAVWANVSGAVVGSYLDALWGCSERGYKLARRARAFALASA